MRRFWFIAMDVTSVLFGFGSRLYLWALAHASVHMEQGYGKKLGEGEPF
jgi:hypothetical protein